MQGKDAKNMMIIGGATLLGGVINYAVHPLAVRMLSVADFGEFAAILSIMNIIGFIMRAGSIIALKLIAQHNNQSDFMYYLKHQLRKPLMLIGLGLSILVALCSPLLAQGLNISSYRDIIIMGGIIVTNIYGIILGAILQSGGWFISIAKVGLVEPIIRLGCVIIALLTIHNSTSTVAAIVIAGLIGFGFTEYLVCRHLGNQHTIEQYDGTLINQIKHSASTYLLLIIVTVMIGVLTNSDILIAQYIFGSEISGTYAAVAVIAKFVVFIGLAAETVLLPKLFTNSNHITRSQVIKTIAILRGFGLLAWGGSWLMGGHILDLLKPGLGNHQNLLLWSIIINWCILTISISSKTLTNQGSRLPLWVIGGGGLIGYVLLSSSTTIESYLMISGIILGIISLLTQGWWLRSSKSDLSHSNL